MSDDPWGTDPWAPASNDSETGFPEEPTNPDGSGASWQTFDDKKERPVSGDNDQISITLKGGAGFDSPWIVVKATSPQEALDILNQVRELGLMDITAKAASMFQGNVGGAPRAAGGGARPAGNSGGGAAAVVPPGVQSRNCAHGPMQYKSGMSKFNKPYQAFFCPTPKGSADQCEAVFL